MLSRAAISSIIAPITIEQLEADLAEHRFHDPFLPEEQVKPVYTPPVVDDAGIDIYRRLPEKAQKEVRDNIWRYLGQVQHDYPPEPCVGDA